MRNKRECPAIFLTLVAILFSPLVLGGEGTGGFRFNPSLVKRDPFSAPEKKAGLKGNDLTTFDIMDMRLLAVMSGYGPTQAMLALPNSSTHIVQKGDRLGRRGGRISVISANEVRVRETFTDLDGRTKSTELVIKLEQ